MSSTKSTPPPPYSGHNSRRDNQSVASIQSSSSSSSRSARSNAHPAVESAVTRLLVAIKQLLESLTQWSQRKMDEEQVSDVYVRLGNDFNAAVAAFAAFNIDMTDLMSVPEDLRDVLETCLAEEATPDNLNVYLPKVRQIITNLLQGLRGKQSMYRRIVSEHQRHRSSHSRTDSRSSKSDKASRRDDDSRHRSQLSRSTIEEEGGEERDQTARQSTRSSGKRQDRRVHTPPPPSPPPVFREPDDEVPPNEKSITSTSSADGHSHRGSVPPQTRQSRHVYQSNDDGLSRESSETLVASSIPPSSHHTTPSEPDKHLSQTVQSAHVPASVKRYSLVDRPVSSPPQSPITVLIEESPATPSESSSRPQTPPIDTLQAPAVASSLAALKKSDVLERRASKRFSTYNITKMTGSRERSTNRRSMAAGSSLTPGDLAVLTEVDEPDVKRDGSVRSNRQIPRTPSPALEVEAAPPVPPLPPLLDIARSQPPPRTLSKTEKGMDEFPVFDKAPEPAQPTAFSVFLQVGREVKKVTIEPGMSFSSLRMLFVDKFSYNPGL
ncbi:hypothetical protein AZE42_07318, partial [Rhizopogon vesiculosus]